MNFLRNLFKEKPYVELVHITGILPIKKYGTHSILNMSSFGSNDDVLSLLDHLNYKNGYVDILNKEVTDLSH